MNSAADLFEEITKSINRLIYKPIIIYIFFGVITTVSLILILRKRRKQ
jgi:hypothetical protein